MKESKKINTSELEKINGPFFGFASILFLMSLFILILFYTNFSYIETLLDKLYFENIVSYVNENIKYFITLLFTYFIFLAYIGRKKGKIFSSEGDRLEDKYGGALLLGYQFINFFLFIHLKFLIDRNGIDSFLWLQEFIIFILFIINFSIIISDDLFNKFVKTKYFKKVYLFFIILFFILPFFKVGYLEITILFIISSILIPFIHKLNQAYINNHNNLAFLELMNKNGRKDIRLILSDYFKDFGDDDIFKKINTLYLCFTLLPSLISSSIVLSFLTPFIGVLYDFNLFSIIYIHLSFIIIYISLNLISNKFGEYVTIRSNDKEYKGYLLENTNDKIILLTKSNTFVLKPEKIEYIKTLKKR